MKKSFIILLMLMMPLAGCITSTGDRVVEKLSLTDDQVLAYTDGAYTVARAIISTPEVWAKIDKENQLKLQGLESLYLSTREKHLSAAGEDTTLIDTLISTADNLISIMEYVPVLSQYATKIKIAKATVETFKHMLAPTSTIKAPQTMEVPVGKETKL